MTMQWTPQLQFAPLPLRAVLRTPPLLEPSDSLGRMLLTLRQLGLTELPVMQDGKLRGMISQEAALPALLAATEAERDTLLQQEILQFLTPPAALARPQSTPQEIGVLCARYQMATVPVVDEDDCCLGIVLASDLLLPTMPLPKPSPIGGMATPFGVYLTDGTQQAGVGNLALIAGGAFMGILFWATEGAVELAVNFGLKHKWLSQSIFGNIFADNPTGGASPLTTTLVAVLLSTLGFLAFLLLMRVTRLAGYHAAEHQTVHAMERDEPLVPHVVARMPRPHPRCGTNLMAAGFLFFTTLTICKAIPALADIGEIVAFLFTASTWRRFGTFLQARFTTRPASERELRSGIAAGEALLEKYYNSPPARPNVWRRIWCMGMLQVLMGMMLTSAVFGAATWGLEHFGRH